MKKEIKRIIGIKGDAYWYCEKERQKVVVEYVDGEVGEVEMWYECKLDEDGNEINDGEWSTMFDGSKLYYKYPGYFVESFDISNVEYIEE